MNKVIIGMACHNSKENNRFQYTFLTVENMLKQGVHERHDLRIVINGPCEKTKDYLNKLPKQVTVIFNSENVGTARALNQVIRERQNGQHAIKVDDDVIIHDSKWVEKLLEVVQREPQIGIVGLKRKDLIQTTWNPNRDFSCELIMLPHELGQRWINVEKTNDIMGTCTLFNSALLDKIGFMYQPSLYGLDDNDISWRSRVAGFWNVHLSDIEIDHIDNPPPGYQQWKDKQHAEVFPAYHTRINEIIRGERPVYQEFY